MLCQVDRQTVAPVSIDISGRHPLTIEVSRLHGVFDVEALDNRYGVETIRGPSVGGAVLGACRQLTLRHSGQPNLRCRVLPAPKTALSNQVLFERVAEHVGMAGI